jgi:N-terminal domain of anti-restriction factor ArdC
MEYPSSSNHNGNGAAFTANLGVANGIASNTASESENRKPTTAQQLVRENVQYLIEQLEAGHSEALTAYLNAMVHFHNYSFGNVLAIARQRPQATHVAGMWTWNQLNRRVKRGERGIAILAPLIAKPTRTSQRAATKLAMAGQRCSAFARCMCGTRHRPKAHRCRSWRR